MCPDFQNTLKSYDCWDSMVLAQKQTHRWMEQTTEPRNEPTLSWEIKSTTKETRIYYKEKRVSSTNDVGKSAQLHSK